MIRPTNCPYRELTTAPCYNCPNYIHDTDECVFTRMNCHASNTNTISAPSYEEILDDYKKKREELLTLSKEQLVDLIIGKPTYY